MKIALHGYARTGKDTVGAYLVERYGFTRVALGDVIKHDLDPMIRQHFGFSAFTENDDEKAKIRRTLVAWGYDNYDSIAARFWDAIPDLAVNTRLFRVQEAEEWVRRGGVIWEVCRPGFGPAEPQEAAELEACRERGLVSDRVWNSGGLAALQWEVNALLAMSGFEAIA